MFRKNIYLAIYLYFETECKQANSKSIKVNTPMTDNEPITDK